MPTTSRRHFLQASAVASMYPLVERAEERHAIDECHLPETFASLKPLGSRVKPITAEEFQARVQNAQQFMAAAPEAANASGPQLDAIFLAPGTSLYYFSGVRWQPSERLLALVIPRSGQPLFVVPGFEEGRLREQLQYPAEVRVWQEDESPTAVVAAALAERGMRTGTIGMEERTAYTFFSHFRNAAPGFDCVPADKVTIACRWRKSAHEQELMRLACDATFDVFKAVFNSLKPGMTHDEIGRMISAGFSKMGLQGGALVLLGAASALPHGSRHPTVLKEGDSILIDGGCSVEGYESDVTRTSVLGKPSQKLLQVFDIVRKAQDVTLDAARAGRLTGSVDAAARAVVTNGGFGPDYKFFTHRVGHGMGLDGHEHPYLVRNSQTVLEPGMTFSNEPGIYIPGEFGLRCEDDMVIAADGPAQLLTPGFAPSLQHPFA